MPRQIINDAEAPYGGYMIGLNMSIMLMKVLSHSAHVGYKLRIVANRVSVS